MAFLEIVTGPGQGTRFELEQDQTTIGRAADNVVVIDDAAVSSHHCCVTRDEREYSLRDLGSTNGTTLNRSAVTLSRLNPGDTIGVGDVEIRFDGEDVDTLSPADAGEEAPTPKRPPTTSRTAVVRPPTIKGASPFGAKRDRRWIWGIAIFVIVAFVLAALAWFLMALFQQ